MITIEAAKKEGLKPTLKMKDLIPEREYVIMSVSPAYDEPLSGESKYGTWYLYGVMIHEYNTVDLKTLKEEKKVFDSPEEVSYFTNEGATMKKKLDSTAPGTRFKVTMEENESNGKKYYIATDIDEEPTMPAAQAAEPDKGDEEIVAMYKSKLTVLGEEDALMFTATKFGITVDELKTKL